ncbi:unnamed protein product [Adineta steineri]|uniref:Peptidase S1 domain-containing protein n=1 Tax=Adineta steineri TaxID=433720 RepID=A0A814UE84_9BILA|nr:unnamed protein product [Adineta steineri]CAF1172376.1 unnamed protein product [Adineta steineri]CAF3755597.1 unnamed protein product [Adineta steineri]CAF3975272.1 unnamed protein product [Adineta steineri]
MFNNLLLQFIIFDFIIINSDSKSQSRQYQNIFNNPHFYYQQQQQQQQQQLSVDGQKWFYSSNQQPLAYSWYWTNNDVPSSNFYKNSLSLQQTNQLANWACGRSQVTNRFARIMGGQDAVPHSYPWMVSLAKRSLNNLHLCGGVLLTRRHVLTAAHCMEDFKGVSDMNILAGIHYITEKKHSIPALTIDIHPQYDAETFANDVAIVTLTTPLPENDPRIGTICLPTDELTGKNYPSEKSSGIAIGWGSTKFGGQPSTALKQVILPILETTKWPCNIYVTYAQGQICAGELSGGSDTCQADSGGPLMVENSDGRWEIIGITSFGKSCGKPNSPGIYTRVDTYNSFIRSSISLSRNAPYYSSSSSSSPTSRIYAYNILFNILLIVSFLM